MADHLFIVVYRNKGEIWQAKTNGIFTERRLADSFVECSKASGFNAEMAVVEGWITTDDEEVDDKLGAFI